MNTRQLKAKESANLACINRAGISSTLLFITETGLAKGILDATEPIRAMLKDGRIHDYAEQGQGEGHKKMLEAVIHTSGSATRTEVSLYRPATKKGDPRIWFYGFRRFSEPDDVCVVFVHGRRINLLNLTQSSLAESMTRGSDTPLTRFFIATTQTATAIASELVGKLRQLASNGPLEAVCEGDTAIGRSVETALGIRINSDRAPDYKGIELKSGREAIGGRETRATLFACVPDWSISRCKSSRQILNEFGYLRDGQFKLYCTVSSQRPNAQGLMFHIEDAHRWLREKYVRDAKREVAVWRLSTLEESLAAKHKETFWIKAASVRRNGREHFNLLSVIHTKNPNLPQLERMLQDGSVTMDHLIKRTPTGGAKEKGPLFKIVRPRLKELFLGEPSQYPLS